MRGCSTTPTERASAAGKLREPPGTAAPRMHDRAPDDEPHDPVGPPPRDDRRRRTRGDGFELVVLSLQNGARAGRAALAGQPRAIAIGAHGVVVAQQDRVDGFDPFGPRLFAYEHAVHEVAAHPDGWIVRRGTGDDLDRLAALARMDAMGLWLVLVAAGAIALLRLLPRAGGAGGS